MDTDLTKTKNKTGLVKARPGLFYGWYIVGAGLLINTFILGVLAKGFTALVNPMAVSFGWSYAVISGAQSLKGAETGVLNPLMGRIVDRYPLKWLVFIGVCILGVGYFLLSRITSVTMLYVSFTVIALGSSLGGSMAPTAAVARWFKKDVGKANGIYAVGLGLGGFAVPALTMLIDAYGWQTSIIIVGATVLVTGIPLAIIFRDRPEDYGLFPDGRPPDKSEKSRRLPTQDFSIEVKDAIRSRVFWQMGIADMLQMAGYGAWALHVMPYLVGQGIDKATAAWLTLLVNLISIPARFVFGWLTDTFPNKYACAFYMGLSGVALLIFAILKVDSPPILTVVYVITGSIGLAGQVALRAPRVRQYFGAKNFGSIYGLHNIFISVATVAAPPLAGLVYDLRGDYGASWLVLGIASFVSMVIMLAIPLPSKSPRRLLPF